MITSKFGGEVSGVLGSIISDGEDAERDIYARAFPKAAAIKAAKLEKRSPKMPVSSEADLTDIDYDASDVQIQFAE